MLNQEFKEAIKIINLSFKENKIKWALIGSVNMATQGMNVNPNDLDIVIQLRDLRRIKDIFSNYTPSSIKELKISGEEPAWEIKITIGDLEVHILGERDTGKYVSKLLANRIIQMRLDDMEISCFTLDAEAQAYAETNRKNKADLINNFLKHNK